MKNVTIKSKLLLILYLVVIGFIFLSTIFLFSEKNVILDEKRLKLTNIVELAYSLVEAEYKDFKDGKIDKMLQKAML